MISQVARLNDELHFSWQCNSFDVVIKLARLIDELENITRLSNHHCFGDSEQLACSDEGLEVMSLFIILSVIENNRHVRMTKWQISEQPNSLRDCKQLACFNDEYKE